MQPAIHLLCSQFHSWLQWCVSSNEAASEGLLPKSREAAGDIERCGTENYIRCLLFGTPPVTRLLQKELPEKFRTILKQLELEQPKKVSEITNRIRHSINSGSAYIQQEMKQCQRTPEISGVCKKSFMTFQNLAWISAPGTCKSFQFSTLQALFLSIFLS